MATATQILTVTNSINTLITDQHNEEITGTVMNSVLHLIKALATVVYTGTFDNADLDVDFDVEITHNLNTLFPDVMLIDNNDRLLSAANFELTILDANTVRIGMAAAIDAAHSYKISKND